MSENKSLEIGPYYISKKDYIFYNYNLFLSPGYLRFSLVCLAILLLQSSCTFALQTKSLLPILLIIFVVFVVLPVFIPILFLLLDKIFGIFNLKDYFKNPSKIRISEEGVMSQQNNNVVTIAWSNISNLVSGKNSVYINYRPFGGLIIPKSIFSSKLAEDEFVELVRFYSGKKIINTPMP